MSVRPGFVGDHERWRTRSSAERKQIGKFKADLAKLVDSYLKDRMSPDDILFALGQEMNVDLETRRSELDSF